MARTSTVLVLRTCNADMSSVRGFQWPRKGPVAAPDWDPEPVCGRGLHGFLWGEGDGDLAQWHGDAKWLVIAVRADEIVDLVGKVKFPRGRVVYCGDRLGATAYLADHGGRGRAIVGGTAKAGDDGMATAGCRGSATAGYGGTAVAGRLGTAVAGDFGTALAGYGGSATAGDDGMATAGCRGSATAGCRGTAVAGRLGTAVAGDDGTALAGYGGTATAGYGGMAAAGDGGTAVAGDDGTAMAGRHGTAAAGPGGQIRIEWWDGSRRRLAVGYVGEGVLLFVPHRCQDGVLVPALDTAIVAP